MYLCIYFFHLILVGIPSSLIFLLRTGGGGFLLNGLNTLSVANLFFDGP